MRTIREEPDAAAIAMRDDIYNLIDEQRFRIGIRVIIIGACKKGTPTTCNFNYSGALTETVLLGNVSFRTGKALEWDAAALELPNCTAAAQYIRKEYREGWEVA